MTNIDLTSLVGSLMIYTGTDPVIRGVLYIERNNVYILHNQPERQGSRPHSNIYSAQYKYSWGIGCISDSEDILQYLIPLTNSCLFARAAHIISDGTFSWQVVDTSTYLLALKIDDKIVWKEREELENAGFRVTNLEV